MCVSLGNISSVNSFGAFFKIYFFFLRSLSFRRPRAPQSGQTSHSSSEGRQVETAYFCPREARVCQQSATRTLHFEPRVVSVSRICPRQRPEAKFIVIPILMKAPFCFDKQRRPQRRSRGKGRCVCLWCRNTRHFAMVSGPKRQGRGGGRGEEFRPGPWDFGPQITPCARACVFLAYIPL